MPRCPADAHQTPEQHRAPRPQSRPPRPVLTVLLLGLHVYYGDLGRKARRKKLILDMLLPWISSEQ